MAKQNKKLTIAILSAIMALCLVFTGLFVQTKSTAVASAAVPTPTSTYNITQTGTISADKWGGIALLSSIKTPIKNGDTFYIGYTVDSATTTLSSSVLQGVLVTSYSGSRVHVDLTTGSGAGIHRGVFYTEEKSFLTAGASYLITITITEDETTAGKMSVGSSVKKTTSSGSTSYGMWDSRGSITNATDKEYTVGLWLSMAAYTCEDLSISNFYIMDANGNDLGVKNVVESGNTIDLSIKADKVSATFKDEKGTALTELTQNVKADTQITLPQGVSEGFVCWKDASGNLYKAGDNVTVSAAISFTEVCTVVAEKTYAIYQNGDVVTNKWGGFNLMNKTKKTFEVGETVYMGYTVNDVDVNFSSVSSPSHGLIFTNYSGTRTHVDLTIASWYNAETQPSAKAGIQPYTAYSANNNLLEKGATYRIAITLVQSGEDYGIETQIIKITDNSISTIKMTDWKRWFNSVEAESGLDYYFGILLTLSGDVALEYKDIAMSNVYIADDTGADLGVTARSDVNENINLAIGEQAEVINVTYKNAKGEVINEYSAQKDLGVFTAENGVSENFVCWKAGDLTYKPGDTIVAFNDIELQEVAVDIALINGANIRMSNPTGLRFSSLMIKSMYDVLERTFGAENIVTGTLILPTDYLTEGVEFTIEDLTAKTIKYKNIVNDGANAVETIDGEEYYVYHASLVNILAQNLTREFSARAYVTVKLNEGESITVYSGYSEENNSRSVYEVACGKYEMYKDGDMLEDIDVAIFEGFINAVVVIVGDENGYTVEVPSAYDDSIYNVSSDGNVITITTKDGYDISVVKNVRINGKNYVNFVVENEQIVITVA